MAAPNYRPVGNFVPREDGQPIFQSPEMISRPWRASSGPNPHPSGIEMQQNQRPSQISFASEGSDPALKPSMVENTYESRPFLPHAPHKSVSADSTVTTASFKAKSGRQLGHLVTGALLRWIISFLLCAAWVLATLLVSREGAVTEFRKRVFNAVTTGIALALGLNIASAFKGMALNMRWPILANRDRNLVELDLILRADSLSELSKLVFATRRVGVISACIFWLILNIAAQAGIAAVSLTYGFETDSTGVLLNTGNTSTADMQHFYPLGTSSIAVGASESYEDESYTAHQYGSIIPLFGFNQTTELPKQGQRLLQQDGYVYYNNETSVGTYIFFDSTPDAGLSTISVFSDRSINATYECESHEVTKYGNGSFDYVDVANIGQVYVSQILPNSTTFFNNDNTTCPDRNPRCTVIEVLETSSTQPWYYRCNVTLGVTQNDPQNLSFVGDVMAYYATASIAQGGFVGYVDTAGTVVQTAQIFPQSSIFGATANGDKNMMGITIGYFALGAIAVAASYNPSKFYIGQTPTEGQHLTIGHHLTFYGILALILFFQAIFIIIVAVWANKVKVGEDSHLGMAVLMRPIADRLDDIGHGKETKAFKRAKKQVKVKYERDPITSLWSFKMKN